MYWQKANSVRSVYFKILFALLLTASYLCVSFGESGAQNPSLVPEPEVTVASSCLGNDGQIDVHVFNDDSVAHEYTIVQSGGKRTRTVQPQRYWRLPRTGRADGAHRVRVSTEGATVYDETFQVKCDSAKATSSPAEVQIVQECRPSGGFILFQFTNSTAARRPYIIEFERLPNRSVAAAPYAAAVRGVSSRPDGIYDVTVRSGDRKMLVETQVVVNCKGPAAVPALASPTRLDGYYATSKWRVSNPKQGAQVEIEWYLNGRLIDGSAVEPSQPGYVRLMKSNDDRAVASSQVRGQVCSRARSIQPAGGAPSRWSAPSCTNSSAMKSTPTVRSDRLAISGNKATVSWNNNRDKNEVRWYRDGALVNTAVVRSGIYSSTYDGGTQPAKLCAEVRRFSSGSSLSSAPTKRACGTINQQFRVEARDITRSNTGVVTVPVFAVPGSSSVSATVVEVDYDRTKLSVVDCKSAPGTTAFGCNTNFDGDTIRFGVAKDGVADWTAPAQIATVVFRARASSSSTVGLFADDANSSSGRIIGGGRTSTIPSGATAAAESTAESAQSFFYDFGTSAEISQNTAVRTGPYASVPWGDVDCSGSLTLLDGLILAQFVAEMPVTMSCPIAADIDFNGIINNDDVRTILECDVGNTVADSASCTGKTPSTLVAASQASSDWAISGKPYTKDLSGLDVDDNGDYYGVTQNKTSSPGGIFKVAAQALESPSGKFSSALHDFGDSEGIAWIGADPKRRGNTLLLIVNEAQHVGLFTYDGKQTLTKLTDYDLSSVLPSTGGDGFEGIAYIGKFGENYRVYLGDEIRHTLYEVDLPLSDQANKTVGSSRRVISVVGDITEISGLDIHPADPNTMVIIDEANGVDKKILFASLSSVDSGGPVETQAQRVFDLAVMRQPEGVALQSNAVGWVAGERFEMKKMIGPS